MRRPALFALVVLALLATRPSPAPAQTVSLQALIDAAPAGSILRVPPGVYRESLRVTKPLILEGGGKAEIRGSSIWPEWVPTGNTWRSEWTVPNFSPENPGAAFVDTFQATHPEQVFVDGAELRQVAGQPAAGQFTLDSSRRVVLGANPAGRTVEVTQRTTWLVPQADDVTVRGFVMRHAATHGQGWAIGNNDRLRFTLADSELSDTHGSMLSLGGGNTSATYTGNTLTRAGNTAISSYNDGSGTITGNTIFHNGYGGWDWQWQAGGIKTAASHNLTVSRNLIYDNNGPGLWCDIACENVTYADNVIRDHPASGIFFEISTGARITGNRIERTRGFPAISVSSSGNVEVDNNTVVDSKIGIQAYADNRADARPLTNVNIHDNTIVMAEPGISLLADDYGSGEATRSSSNNRGLNNIVRYPSAEVAGQDRFGWGDARYALIADFAKTPLGQGITYLTIPTLTPTPSPSATPTVPAPTATASHTPTTTPSPVATAPASSTPTLQPLATPTLPVESCEMILIRNGLEIRRAAVPHEWC